MAETTPTQRSAHLICEVCEPECQGCKNGYLIQGNSSASRPGSHMPVTFEGDEPEEPTSWELIGAGAQWALLALAFVCTLLAAAGAFLTN